MAWYLIGTIFLVGLWGTLSKHNMVKKVMALSIANSAIVLLFLYYGSFSGETAPIETIPVQAEKLADPLPQALMLTAIVVGVCIMALALSLIYRLYLKFGTLDMRVVEKRAWKPNE